MTQITFKLTDTQCACSRYKLHGFSPKRFFVQCEILNTDRRVLFSAKLVQSTKSELRPFVQELFAELNTLQRQNLQLLSINNSMSQTHAEIGVLLSERQDNEEVRKLSNDVRELLDKNDATVTELRTESDEGKGDHYHFYSLDCKYHGSFCFAC